jgi:hypothetical protein
VRGRREISADRRAELAQWAAALEGSESAELRAAGRAIAQLCDENLELRERLAAHEADGPQPPAPPDVGTTARSARQGWPRRAGPPGGTMAQVWSGLSSRRIALLAAAFALAAAAALVAVRAATPALQVSGVPANAVLGPGDLAQLEFTSVQAADWSLDGRHVVPRRRGDVLVFHPTGLADGQHSLVIRRSAGFLRSASRTFTFVVDTSAPVLKLDRPAVVQAGKQLVLEGVVEPGAKLTAGSQRVPLDDEGRFEHSRQVAPASLKLVATDAAGNASRWRVPVTVAPRVPAEPVRAVHVTAYGWADDTLRAGVLRLIAEHRINAVELDLKDEAGEIGWNAPVPLARRMGAALTIFDLRQAVAQLHDRGVRVIGRLVCFRDPIHAGYAWKHGRRDEVVQTPGGDPYAGYGGFTNPASDAVRKYNIDVAVAAAAAGVDEILYDYVRRPDGPLETMRFPGLHGAPEGAIVEFLGESRRALAKSGVLVGASVFGVAATRPTEVAQDIPRMARQVDYVAPMVYPSHWTLGEYDVANPNASPYLIVRRSLADFARQVRGTGARVVPWLQDFTLGYTYGAKEVSAQIRASRDAGADEFLLWDPAVTYTSDALAQNARVPAIGLGTFQALKAPGPVRLADARPPATPATRGAVVRPPAAPATHAAGGPVSALRPNELGQILVLMHHQIRADRVGDYDQTPTEFRLELQQLWARGYRPIAVGDLLDRRLDLPKGTSPVVMTFDDATKEQLALDAAGQPKPDTAVGIMFEFARTHPGFTPRGTFYVNRDPFAVADGGRLLRWLDDHGFELGDHTLDHVPLRTLADNEVQRQVALGAAVIEGAIPGYRVRSLALPLGSMPRNERLMLRGTWQGHAYGPFAVLLIGANPAPSPYSRSFDRTAIPRVRSSHLPYSGAEDFTYGYWLRMLDRNPGSRYVSDGDPQTITAPAAAQAEVAARYRGQFAPSG